MAWLGQPRRNSERDARCVTEIERDRGQSLSVCLPLSAAVMCETSLHTLRHVQSTKSAVTYMLQSLPLPHLFTLAQPFLLFTPLARWQLLLELLENLIKMLAFFVHELIFTSLPKTEKRILSKELRIFTKISHINVYVCVRVCGRGSSPCHIQLSHEAPSAQKLSSAQLRVDSITNMFD